MLLLSSFNRTQYQQNKSKRNSKLKAEPGKSHEKQHINKAGFLNCVKNKHKLLYKFVTLTIKIIPMG